MMDRRQFGRVVRLITISAAACLASAYSVGADSTPQVTLNTSKAGPRVVEDLTERAILRDYRFAWMNLDQALESDSSGPLSGLFAGSASAWLSDTIAAQRSSGLSSRYLNQNHKLDAI